MQIATISNEILSYIIDVMRVDGFDTISIGIVNLHN